MGSWKQEKECRRKYFLNFVYKKKIKPCSACSGSGVYDAKGSPSCGACDGSGKETYDPLKYLYISPREREKAKRRTEYYKKHGERNGPVSMTADVSILHAASNGNICPYCLSTSVKNVGSAPDFFNMNNQYDCMDCGRGWEGY